MAVDATAPGPDGSRGEPDPVERDQAQDETRGSAPHLPAPSVWPVVVGLSLTFALLGIATSLFFTLCGLAAAAVGIGGWIYDLRTEASRG